MTKHQKEEWEERIKFRDTPFEIEIDGKPVDDLEQIYSLIRQTREEAKREALEECLQSLPEVIDINDQTNYRESSYEDGVDDGFNKCLVEVKLAIHSLSTAGKETP